MTILQLTNTRVSDHGPEARSIADCARALAAEGHDVTLVTPAEEPSADLSDREPRFMDAALWPAGEVPSPVPDPPAAPQVVHVHHPFLAGEEALRLSELHDAPLVFSATLHYDNPFPLPPREAARLHTFIEKLGVCFANRCDLVVAPSAAVAVKLIESGVVRPIHVVPADDEPGPRARRLSKLYAESVAVRRARGPARECGTAGRLHRELARAWNKIIPSAPFPARRARGVFAGLRDGFVSPC